jgi:putative transposase
VTTNSDKNDPPKRKHPVHGIVFVDGQPTIVFDTVCTKDRSRWLANDDVHRLLREVWQEAQAWWLGRNVIMPDHIHFFAAATESAIPYENWVRYWKSQFTKRHNVPGNRWLPHHWDTRIRNAAAYAEKWDYVSQNPERGGLVTKSMNWPYQGIIHELPWD